MLMLDINLYWCFKDIGVIVLVVVVVVSSPHKSPRRGVLRFRSTQSMTIPLLVWSASISPAH